MDSPSTGPVGSSHLFFGGEIECKRVRCSEVLVVRVAPHGGHPGPKHSGGSMKTSRVIPICLALTLTTLTSAAAQDSRGTEPHGQHGDEHGPAGLFEELQQWGYSEDEIAAIQVMVEAVGQSIEEIMGFHDHEGPAQDAEEVRMAGESALMRFHDAYESVVVELEEEHARIFTGMVFEHLFHLLAPHGHDTEEGQPDIGGQHRHG